MAAATQAPQTAPDVEAAPVAPRKANRQVAGYRVGDCTVIRDRGFNPAMVEAIFERHDWVATSVHENEMVGINGVRMVVEGPKNDEAYEMVSLPKPVASVLRNRRAMLKAARDEWRKATARDLGGTKETEQR